VILEEELKGLIKVKYLLKSTNVITLTPHDNLNTAIEKFSLKDLGEIPVVDFANRKKVVGMLKRGDVFNAYNKEIIRRRI